MKVLFVINGLGTGGAERSLTETLEGSSPAIRPTVVCLDRRTEGVQEQVLTDGLDVRFVTGGFPLQVKAIRQTIANVHPDLVHTTIFEADLAGRLAAVRSNVPVVTSLVNTSYDPIRRSDPSVTAWRLASARVVDGWTARHLTTHFHAITGAVRDAAIRDLHLTPDTITVIERGRDPARLGEPGEKRRATAREALGVSLDAFALATLGRQEFQKGQRHLIEAMPKVLTELPETVLLLAGREGNASRALRSAVRDAGVEAQVRFLGHRDDAPEILAAADVFVFPSLYEGLGGALIEAMALGVPIVASDLPAIREVVDPGRNAVLVQPAAPSDLADGILALAADPVRRAGMGMRGRQVFLERFTLDRSTRRMVSLFERVVAGGRHGPTGYGMT